MFFNVFVVIVFTLIFALSPSRERVRKDKMLRQTSLTKRSCEYGISLNKLPNVIGKEYDFSNCDDLFDTIHDAMQCASYFIDVGANKGYTAAVFLSLWSSKSGVTPLTWWRPSVLSAGKHCKHAPGTTPEAIDCELSCGACNDCRSKFRSPNSYTFCGHLPIKIHSFDGQSMLKTRAQDRIKGHFPGAEHLWDFHTMAVSNTSGSAKFMQHGGSERASMSPSGGLLETVPMTSLDAFVPYGQHVDVLKIDTEGFDVLVIDGAQRLFRENRVNVLVFEVSFRQPELWRERSGLEGVIADLQSHSFECYVPLRGARVSKYKGPRLLKLSGCLMPGDMGNLEPGWTNVYCAHNKRQPELVSMWDRLSDFRLRTHNSILK